MLKVKYTKSFLNKLENLFAESDYILRFEKGSFKSGYCILLEKRVVIVNKYYSLEGKINCLLDIIQQLDFDTSRLSENNIKLFNEIKQTRISF